MAKPTNLEIVNKINNHYNSAEGLVSKMTPRWIAFYKQYRAIIDEKKKKFPYRSKLFIPYSFVSVEGILAKIMEMLFLQRPIIHVFPTEADDKKSANTVEKLLEYQLYFMRIYTKAQQILRDSLIYGTAFVKVYWKREIWEEEITGKIELPTGETTEETITVPHLLYDGPDIVSIPNERIFIDPNTSDLQTGEFVIHEEYKTLAWLKAQKKAGAPYKYLGQIKPYTEVPEQSQMELVKKQITGVDFSEPLTDVDYVRIWEYWTNDIKYTVANKKILIGKEKNTTCPGYKPFIAIKPISLSGELYGYGFMEILHNLQYELNDVRNQRMDNVNLIINRIIKVGTNAGVNLQFLKSIPGAIWLAERPDLITFENPPDVTQSAYLEEEVIKSDMQHAIGDYDYFRGASPETGRETATTVIRLQEAAMNRIAGITRFIEDSFLIPLAQIIMELNKQNLDVEKSVRILGESGADWAEIKATDINKFYDFQPMGSIRASYRRQQEKEKALQLMQLLLPMAEVLNLNIPMFVMDMLGDMGYPNAGKYILPQVSPDLMQLGQKQMGGPGGAPPGPGGAPPPPPPQTMPGR